MKVFSKYLAEDYFMNKYLYNAGFRARMAPSPSNQRVPQRSLRTIYDRQVRWSRLRRRIMWTTAILEPLLECVPVGMIGTAALTSAFPTHFGGRGLEMFGLHVACWIGVDCCLYHVVTGTTPSVSISDTVDWLRSWAIREVGTIAMSLHGFVSNKVLWRGKEYELARDAIVIVPHDKSL
jgi:ceramide glucosyltransferase